jgi:protein-L-isoaspartate(D-aspartate) O-methyltransferase
MVATMTEALEVIPDMKVLEIGTGSGYQAAILVHLGARVYSVERLLSISEAAAERLERLGYAVQLRVGDGTLGWPEEAPFDRIIVTAGAPALPPPLLEQLSSEGRLVIPVEDGMAQVLRVYRRGPSGLLEERREHCTFVPLIGVHGWES